jgi:predicted nucleic acid-binding protein
MAYLLDTGILLRLVNAQDASHGMIQQSIRALIAHQESLHITTQNVAEFLNVATRPVANNGFGWAPQFAVSALSLEIEPICSILVESSGLPAELKRLATTYTVVGKQIHDARLVAMMLVSQVGNLLTLNDADFRRYAAEGIHVVTPISLINSP